MPFERSYKMVVFSITSNGFKENIGQAKIGKAIVCFRELRLHNFIHLLKPFQQSNKTDSRLIEFPNTGRKLICILLNLQKGHVPLHKKLTVISKALADLFYECLVAYLLTSFHIRLSIDEFNLNFHRINKLVYPNQLIRDWLLNIETADVKMFLNPALPNPALMTTGDRLC